MFTGLLLLLALSLSGCGAPDGTAQASLQLADPAALQPAGLAGERLSVAASTSIIGDIAEAIGGDWVELAILIPRGSDPHAYQATPGDLRALDDANLIVINGFDLEHPLEDLLIPASQLVPVISLSEGLQPRTLTDDGQDGLDPHVWLDPNLVLHWVDRLEAAFTSLDPDRATGYRERAESYRQALRQLDTQIAGAVADIPPGRRKLVFDHLVMGYFADRYGFEIVSALVPSFSSAAEMSPRELAALSARIQAEGIPAIFIGMEASTRLASQLGQDLGIQVVRLYDGSLGPPGSPGETYLKMMQYNVLAITEALSTE